MEIKVQYTTLVTKTVNIKVSDKFNNLPNLFDEGSEKWNKLSDELVEKVYAKLPEDADIVKIFDAETNKMIY